MKVFELKLKAKELKIKRCYRFRKNYIISWIIIGPTLKDLDISELKLLSKKTWNKNIFKCEKRIFNTKYKKAISFS